MPIFKISTDCLDQIIRSSDCHMFYHGQLDRKSFNRFHLPVCKCITLRWDELYSLWLGKWNEGLIRRIKATNWGARRNFIDIGYGGTKEMESVRGLVGYVVKQRFRLLALLELYAKRSTASFSCGHRLVLNFVNPYLHVVSSVV